MPHKKATLKFIGGMIGGVLLFCVWQAIRSDPPSVLLPNNVSLDEVLRGGTEHPPMGWHVIRYTKYSLKEEFTLRRLRFRIEDSLGQANMGVPNPARDIELTMALADCSSHTGENYLLAKELIPAPYIYGSNGFCLGFMFGGTNQARVRDWALLHEQQIARNGVISHRDKQPKPTALGVPRQEPFLTNQCAVIRDTKGVVKIIPLNCLRAYKDAGLIKLPAKGDQAKGAGS
ncbi:MAG TPA: hypothetical protein VMZ27_12470 [Candidatus Saccharimonadales bacterium]|nr:hypothetical protein [Candidatus Saccharimonadales bacterium]